MPATYLKLFPKQPSNVLVSHLRPINIRTPFSPLIDLDIEQLNLAQCPESTKLLTRLDMILWSLLQRKSSQSKNTQWDLLSCSDESEVWHLSAALMTWLELQLIILLTWICLHFSFLIKCYYLDTLAEMNQILPKMYIFYSKSLNFHVSSNTLSEN